MTDPTDPFLLRGLRDIDVDSPLASLATITAPQFIKTLNHGDLPRWLDTLADLPALHPERVDLQTGVKFDSPGIADEQVQALEQQLRSFIPWRKGPFELFGVQLDTEWRSDLKWDRLLPHIESLQDRTVLDVGCGNGYHCWRSLGEGARLVIGIEPYLLYVMQFLAVKSFLRCKPCYVLPIRLEHYPGPVRFYDTVFSMGVLYHVRSPIDHLLLLKKCLKPGGQLVLESLIVEGPQGYCLTPEGRYARMGNVWFIPSKDTLFRWLYRCGFAEARLVDVSETTATEQRKTSWMPFESLTDGLDPDDPSRTCEGLPAPRRALITASIPR